MNNHTTSERYQDVLRRFQAVRRREIRLELVFGIEAAFLIVVCTILAAVLAGEIFTPGVGIRTGMFFAAAAGSAAVIAWFIGRPLLRMAGILSSADNRMIAGRVGKHFPAVRDRLLDAIEIYEQRDRLAAHYSPDLIDASFSDLWEQIRPLNFSDALSTASVRRMRNLVWYVFAVAALVLVISPGGFFTSFYRLAHFQETFAEPLPVRFVIEPGNAEAVRGQTVDITIRTEGKPVSSVTLFTRPQGQIEFDRAELLSRNGVFKTSLASLRSTTEYFASASDVQSGHYTISVVDRPLIRSFRLTVTPPGYTRLPQTVLPDNIGDISGYPGTRVSVALEASKPVDSASIQMYNNPRVPLALSDAGSRAGGGFSIRARSTYHFVLTDHEGLSNPDPIEYTISTVADAPPSVEIVSPGKNADLNESMTLDLLIRAKDDFGFSKLCLAWRLTESKYVDSAKSPTFIDLPLSPGQTSPAEVLYHWDLTGLHLVPEDVISYYAEVFDNDNVNGPKSAVSETYQLRLPSLEEIFSDVDKSHDQASGTMQEAAQQAEQLRQDMEELQREMKVSQSKPDWQQQKKAEELSQRYEAMRKNVEDATRKLDDMMKKMDENNLLSEQTMEKYEELQKLMKELDSPELRDALKKLQSSMKDLSSEQLRQAMDQLKYSEEQFREGLERTIELLKRIRIEEKADELLKRAGEALKQQESAEQETKNAAGDRKKEEETAKKQDDLAREAEEMKKDASELQQKMEELPDEMPVQKMAEANKQLAESDVGQKMKDAGKQLQAGDMQGAQQRQEESRQALENFQQKMKDVRNSMGDRQQKMAVDAMRKNLDDLLELSKEQEAMKDETGTLDPNSGRFRENARKQDDLRNGLESVANKLADLGKKSFAVNPEMTRSIGEAMQHMNQAMQQMEGRQPQSSSGQQGAAMSAMNRAAMAMQSAIDGMMQGGRGGSGMSGLMGQLGSAADQQGGINEGTRGAMGSGNGGGLSQEQQAAYGRLAGRQAAVRKTVEELSREAKNSGDFSKLLGDLDKIAQEMQEVQTDLEQNNVNPNTIQKQDRILSRLLESQQSMRERDYEKRRTSETGTTAPHASPAALDLTTQEGRNRIREELLKVLGEKYSHDYEALIRKYFDRLDTEQPAAQPR